jgi:hypothetical protein
MAMQKRVTIYDSGHRSTISSSFDKYVSNYVRLPVGLLSAEEGGGELE